MDNLHLYHELEALLRNDSKYCMDDGTLIKAKIVEDALNLQPDLLKYLLSHKALKENFFSEASELLVFDKVKFQRFVMNKSFLPDSYTAFKNKIGLTVEDGRFVSESREVVLSWPYKDCVLEGEQTQDDEKRSELFWTENLAPEEVNRLLEPKVLCNFKRYTKDGFTAVEHISKDDNLVIKGNNLLSLASLVKTYEGKIRCIYIDPPYNTHSAANTFAYNNSFNHSSWLTFMKNRLVLAKRLLTEDGLIACAIDHYELFYLGVLMDEIFGVNNQMGVCAVVHNPGGRQDVFSNCT